MADTKTKQYGGEDCPVPVLDYFLADANVLIEGDRLVWLRKDTGYAQTSTYALANPQNVACYGLCKEHLDNTTGNQFNNPATAGVVRGRAARGVFLVNGDGTVTQASIGFPVYLASDATGSNNGLVTVSTSSLLGARPFVGVVTNFVPTGSVPDGGKIMVSVGATVLPAIVPATLQFDYLDIATVYQVAFTAVPGGMSSFNFQATGNINFPAITALIDGMHLSLINQGTGATAVTLVPSGAQNIGVAGSTTTGATAAAPASLKAQSYIANLTLNSWIPGI